MCPMMPAVITTVKLVIGIDPADDLQHLGLLEQLIVRIFAVCCAKGRNQAAPVRAKTLGRKITAVDIRMVGTGIMYEFRKDRTGQPLVTNLLKGHIVANRNVTGKH